MAIKHRPNHQNAPKLQSPNVGKHKQLYETTYQFG